MSSDEETVVKRAAHKKLLAEISDIVKFQHIKKPKRSESAIKNDEFHLIKNRNFSVNECAEKHERKKKKGVSIQSVANIVRKTPNQKKVSNQFQDIFRKSKTLNKPLEAVKAERVLRAVGYDNAKAKLSRWDAIVTKNKSTEQLKFPLLQEKCSMVVDDAKETFGFSQFRYKTQMVKDMEMIYNECFPKPQLNDHSADTPSELLTLEEMKERRKELARLKLRESHRLAKKRLQGKIKSKKYHRLKKKDDMKKKLQEFEELKATDPEAALKEIEKIEKERINERASLRHKNTGTWAKNVKIRAQYDETAKKELEAQLALGRELMQKDQDNESNDSDEYDEDTPSLVINNAAASNPWITTKSDSLNDAFSGYKKFWEKKNANERALQKLKQSETPDHDDNGSLHNYESSINECDDNEEEKEMDTLNFINDLFDKAEDKIHCQVESKLKQLKPQLLGNPNKKVVHENSQKKRETDTARYLEFKRKNQLADVDEALIESNDMETSHETIAIRPSKKILSEIRAIRIEKKAFMRGTNEEIDPNSFLTIKSKHLFLAKNPNSFLNEDGDIQSTNKMSLAEAFENDDIVNDFVLENVNAEEEEKRKLRQSESTSLPGWGSWTGEGVKGKSKQANKHENNLKRKDRVIISTKVVNDKLKKHLISAVPFPFTTIKDFEASLRFPIGKDFVPALAHDKLTASNVITKAGTIIEPMSEDVLVESVSKKQRVMRRKGEKN